MIEPAKIKEAFQRVENENYSFRTYLKNQADLDKLDRQFSELHRELFLNYDCSKCRNCSKEYSASFEEDELYPVAAFLKMTETEFKDKYKETIAVLSESSKGWKKELNLISWNDREPKYDIREWSPDHEKMGKE